MVDQNKVDQNYDEFNEEEQKLLSRDLRKNPTIFTDIIPLKILIPKFLDPFLNANGHGLFLQLLS